MITILFVALGALAAAYIGVWVSSSFTASTPGGTAAWRPTPLLLLIGFVTDFLDTLGIGNFATTTSALRAWKLASDEEIPGTLNAGHTLPVIAEAFIYIAIIEVEFRTLALMIAAAVLGAWFGAGVVSRWPRRAIRIGMGVALIAAAVLMFLSQFQLFPAGGEALGLSGIRLGVAVVGSLVLGALMTLGIGFYAPCMILVSLLGMNARAAFPIMMGACAFLMPVASMRFVRRRRFNPAAALGLTIGGIPGVFLAAYIVRSLPLGTIRWLVIVVVLYTAVSMLRAAAAERAAIRS